MTTYSLNASYIEYSFTQGIVGLDGEVAVNFVMAHGVDTFQTSTANIADGTAAMDVAFGHLNLRTDDALMGDMASSQIYDVDWIGGRTSVMQLFFYDAALGWAAYFVHLGGAALPTFNSVTDATPFFQRASNPFTYADSPSELSFTFFEDLEVIEDDLLELDETQAHDIIRTGDGNDSVIGSFEADTIFAGDGDDIILGGEGEDSIGGGHGDDSLIGELNNDVLTGGFGNDTVLGGDGDDTIIGGKGADVLDGGIGNDEIFGSQGKDIIYGETGNDTLNGDDGQDRLYGDDGDDKISGGNDDDHLWGGKGVDHLIGGGGADKIYGNNGRDTLIGANGRDTLSGGAGNDEISGGGGQDSIDAGKGNDTIYASDGDDTVYAGDGSDQIYLGLGSDVFIWSEGENELYDFSTQDSDLIDLTTASGITGFTDLLDNHLEVSNTGALISDDLGRSLLLHSNAPFEFDANDFVFAV
ncbi:MAG: calcium-binding protein [Paracoccaceae bacterium]